MKINYHKTQLVRFGSLKKAKALYYAGQRWHWSRSTKILGMIIMESRQEMLKENFDILLEKMSKVLNTWRARTLTLLGRILIVNTLVVSLCTQKSTCLPKPDKEFFTRAKKMITNLYGKKRYHKSDTNY